MGAPIQRRVEVFRVHPAAFWVTVIGSLILQKLLPLRISFAHLFDFPLLATIYFALVRQNKIFGIGLGTAVGLLQDAFSHGYIGMYGMAKALAGYLAASASVKFDLEQLLGRLFLAGSLVLVHNFFHWGLSRLLTQAVPPIQPLDLLVGMMVNVAAGLIMFQALDRFRQPP